MVLGFTVGLGRGMEQEIPEMRVILELDGWTKKIEAQQRAVDRGWLTILIIPPLNIRCWGEEIPPAMSKQVKFFRQHSARDELIRFKYEG